MVCTRSGKLLPLTQPVQKRKKKKQQTYLLCSMIRENGDNTAHKCSICMSRFIIQSSAKWMQCPACQDVFHEKCIEHFAMMTNNIDCLKCPSCRTADLPFSFENSAVVEWDHDAADMWWFKGLDESSDSEYCDSDC